MSQPSPSSSLSDAHTTLRDELLDLLIAATKGRFGRDEIDLTANIFDYGYIDSLSGVAFLANIEDRFGIEIDDMEIVERLNTIEALTEHVAGRCR